MKADIIIEKLNMIKHPEGGYYREIYKSDFISQIYYLLKKNQKSEWHRLEKDEILHFYEGSPIEVYTKRGGNFKKYILGQNILYSIVIEKNTWFGMKSQGDYSLIGCTVAPPFKFSDLEIYSNNNTDALPKI